MIHSLVQSADNLSETFDWLNSAEWERYNALTVEKRRNDWLLGRWTAKQLVKSVAGNVPLHEIGIENQESGEPYVVEHGVCGTGQLSISHSNGHAFCAFLPNADAVLGADIELIEPRRPVFVADYFTDEEQERVAAVSAEMRPTLVTAIWSAKEAALKALHKGLSVDTRSVSCLIELDGTDSAEWQTFKIEIDNNRLPDAPELTGAWRVFGRFVLTIATNAAQPLAIAEHVYRHDVSCYGRA